MAGDRLAGFAPEAPAPAGPLGVIAEHVAAHYRVTVPEIMGSRLTPEVVKARHVVFFLSRHITQYSLPRLGRAFGRDHTTVIYGIRKVTNAALNDDKALHELETLRDQILPKIPGRAPLRKIGEGYVTQRDILVQRFAAALDAFLDAAEDNPALLLAELEGLAGRIRSKGGNGKC